MRSEAEVRAHVTLKAAEDDDFRARLIAAPRATVEEEAGIRFPDGYRLHVHEETATDAHVVLPPKPELSREQTGPHLRRGRRVGLMSLLIVATLGTRTRIAPSWELKSTWWLRCAAADTTASGTPDVFGTVRLTYYGRQQSDWPRSGPPVIAYGRHCGSDDSAVGG